MALVNKIKREINAKLIYFGPGLSGKTTNLNHIYAKLKPEFRGKLKLMNIQHDKMLFFDFTPPGGGSVNGFNVRLHIYTIKGGGSGVPPWKMVLKGADGVVFVADSSPERMADNRESLQNLDEYLAAHGQNLADIPLVFEYNKRDRADAVPVEELQRILNPDNLPHFAATAKNGDGVLNALLALVKMVLENLGDSGQVMEETAGQPQGAADRTTQPFAGERSPVESAGYSFAEDEVITADSFAEEELAADSGFAVKTVPLVQGDEPELLLQGGAEMIAPGCLRLPVTIRYAGKEKTVALTLTVSLD